MAGYYHRGGTMGFSFGASTLYFGERQTGAGDKYSYWYCSRSTCFHVCNAFFADINNIRHSRKRRVVYARRAKTEDRYAQKEECW